MDRLDSLRTFIAVADQRSFSEAARSLHISATAASRAVSALEEELGIALFIRTTRAVTLTAEGAAYLERCRPALEELDDARRSVRGELAEPYGSLVLNAPVVFGRLHVLPIVARLLRAHPRLNVRLTLTDRSIRLSEEGVDVAVRVGDLTDSALHAVRLTELKRVLVASPGYLKARGTPADPTELTQHDLIAFDGFAAGSEWRFGESGRPAIRFEPRLLTNSVETAVDAAADGLGIARPLTYQVAREVAEGRLVYLLREFEPPPLPVHLIFQANRRGSANVRALIEAARIYFRDPAIAGLLE